MFGLLMKSSSNEPDSSLDVYFGLPYARYYLSSSCNPLNPNMKIQFLLSCPYTGIHHKQ